MKRMSDRLRVSHLSVNVGNKNILQDVSFTVEKGSVHVIMGPNGSGKSTIAHVLMGHPCFRLSSASSRIILNGEDITHLDTDKRARLGLFLAFQSPIAIPGVSVLNLIRSACDASGKIRVTSLKHIQVTNPLLQRRSSVGGVGIVDFIETLKTTAKKFGISESLLSRGIHDGFSGGERKKIEMLTACMVKPKYAIFDEIDTGLDVDALRVVARSIADLATSGTGVIVITHSLRLLKYLTPDIVHILVAGKIVKHGDVDLARYIEKNGYKEFTRIKE
jgi:Fe-S cluster assembly ATP-binding protein